MEMIAPPDYSDALQDVLVSQSKQEGDEPSGETEERSSMVEVPLEDNEVHTPSFHVLFFNSSFVSAAMLYNYSVLLVFSTLGRPASFFQLYFLCPC